jgi:hypothetical protein
MMNELSIENLQELFVLFATSEYDADREYSLIENSFQFQNARQRWSPGLPPISH